MEEVKGNASSLINLSRDDSIICLQETWLWSFESNVIDCLVPNYDSFVGCSDMNDNISNFQVPRGKGRIAIMWPKSFGKQMKRITKTCLFKYIKKNSPPKILNFQIKNYDIFHIPAQNIDCWYSLKPPRRGGSNEYPQSRF